MTQELLAVGWTIRVGPIHLFLSLYRLAYVGGEQEVSPTSEQVRRGFSPPRSRLAVLLCEGVDRIGGDDQVASFTLAPS